MKKGGFFLVKYWESGFGRELVLLFSVSRLGLMEQLLNLDQWSNSEEKELTDQLVVFYT
jgi:hypothetical protein